MDHNPPTSGEMAASEVASLRRRVGMLESRLVLLEQAVAALIDLLRKGP